MDIIPELCCTPLFLIWMLENGGGNKDMEEGGIKNNKNILM